MTRTPDWATLGYLDGLDEPARGERAELLDHLDAAGFSREEIERGHTDGLLAFLPAERVVMGGTPALTHREIAERAGVDLALLQDVRRAQGLRVPDPDAVEFSEGEVDAARVPALLGGLGLTAEQMVAVSRVLGRGLDQAAQVMRATVLELALEPGLSERELAERYEATVAAIMPHVGPMLDTMVRMHLRNMVRAEAVDAAARLSGRLPGSRDVAVAFADLVGFTRLGEEVPAEEVGRVAERLAVLAAEVSGGPVRMVKTIGDAAMLVSDETGPLVHACLALTEAVAAEGEAFPQIRVGVAAGAATARGGDWFGAPVNLASRICTVARTDSVLVSEAVHEAVVRVSPPEESDLRWSFAGERRLKGVPAPAKLFRVRRKDGGGTA